MKGKPDRTARRQWAAKAALGALVLVGVPSASLAIGAIDAPQGLSSIDGYTMFTPASVDPRVARLVASHGPGTTRLSRFTPAGAVEGETRSVTVAVRVNPESARAYSVRSAIDEAKEKAAPNPGVRITPTRYNLGISRDYQTFARPAPELSSSLSDAGIPDLKEFQPSSGAKEEQSRFAARIALEEKTMTGSAPRTIEGAGDQTVDLGGSYRLTRNLDVTAGVRYSQERDRLAPITDRERQESQSVYIGTEFRF